MLTYVLNADDSPLMPCHPARARELVRRGRARWVRRDTIKLTALREDTVVQRVTVGIDSGAETIGLAAVAERPRRGPRVLLRMVVHARPVQEIKQLLDTRRSYRRGRRSRKWYRRPRVSPVRRVRFSVRVFAKDGKEIGRIPLRQAKALCKPAGNGRPQARKLQGNKIRLLTRRKIGELVPEAKPSAKDVIVRSVDGRVITWFDPKRKDYRFLEQRLLGNPVVHGQKRSKHLHKNPHKKPLARVETVDGRRVIQLLSKSAEKAVRKEVTPNKVPPFRTFGHKRKPKGWLAPSALALKHVHIRALNEARKCIPVSHVRLEICAFNTQKLKTLTIQGVGYQDPAMMYANQNRKHFVLARDNWTCVYCGRKGLGKGSVPLTVDHVIPRSARGSDDVNNLVAVCTTCQAKKGGSHYREFLDNNIEPKEAQRIKHYIEQLAERSRKFAAAAHVGQIKNALLQDLRATPTWGYVTKRDRLDGTRLPKGHEYDAVTIASWGEAVDPRMPPTRTYWMRRYPASKSSRRQKYKANPLGKSARSNPAYAARLVGTGPRRRWVQPVGVNRFADTPAGRVRLRDVVVTRDGRVGYVMKINSNGTLTISETPVGAKDEKSVILGKVERILWRRRGLMESLRYV